MRQPRPLVLATTALLIALASQSCGGATKSTTPSGNGPTTHGDAAGGNGGVQGASGRASSPGARLVEMVGQIAAEVTEANDCDQFASALGAWTGRHQAEFEKLVAEVQAAAESGEADADAAKMDEQIVEGYLSVVEAAADCGDNDDAMRAYEAFNATVEKATY